MNQPSSFCLSPLVLLVPGFDRGLNMQQTRETLWVEARIAETTVERCDDRVLIGLSGFDQAHRRKPCACCQATLILPALAQYFFSYSTATMFREALSQFQANKDARDTHIAEMARATVPSPVVRHANAAIASAVTDAVQRP